MHKIETQRLVLRLPTLQDAAFIKELYNTPDFLKFVGDKKIKSEQDACEYISRNMLNMRDEKGVCLLVVERKVDASALGVCGLIKREQYDAYDIGYGFLPQSYGKGYGLESARAVVDYAKHQPDIDELIAITTSDNERSKKLLTQLGFTYIKVESKLSPTIDLLLYQLPLVNDEAYTQ